MMIIPCLLYLASLAVEPPPRPAAAPPPAITHLAKRRWRLR